MMINHISNLHLLRLTACLVLAMTAACGTKVVGTQQGNGSNDALNKRSQTNSPTPTETGPKVKLPLDTSKIPTVTYCELSQHAANYNRQVVRVRGVYFNGFERMFFYDEHCVENEPPTARKNIPAETWIEWDDNYRRGDTSEEAKQYRAVKSGERKDVTVIGQFFSARDINNTGSGKYQLRIMRVERVMDIVN